MPVFVVLRVGGLTLLKEFESAKSAEVTTWHLLWRGVHPWARWITLSGLVVVLLIIIAAILFYLPLPYLLHLCCISASTMVYLYSDV